MKDKLLEILKLLSERDMEVTKTFNGDGYLDKEISLLCEVILESYNIDTDNKNHDVIYEQLLNFADGDITKNKLLNKYLLKK